MRIWRPFAPPPTDELLARQKDNTAESELFFRRALVALFAGTGGSLVGLASVDVTMPDGTVLLGVQDGLGNFVVPTGLNSWAIQPGANVFTALATATDGSSKSATLTLWGQSSSVPDMGSPLALLGLGLFGLYPVARRFKR